MFSAILDTVVAISAFGGLALGIFNALKARSKTSISYRWELSHNYADVPHVLSSENFEASLRDGLAYLLPGADDIYAHPVKLRIVVRADRRGTTPETIEFVELGDANRRVSFARQPGTTDSADLTIYPNSHVDWTFDWASIARQLSNSYPEKSFPDVSIRLSKGGSQNRRFLDAPSIPATEIRAVVETCKKVWANYPNSMGQVADLA